MLVPATSSVDYQEIHEVLPLLFGVCLQAASSKNATNKCLDVTSLIFNRYSWHLAKFSIAVSNFVFLSKLRFAFEAFWVRELKIQCPFHGVHAFQEPDCNQITHQLSWSTVLNSPPTRTHRTEISDLFWSSAICSTISEISSTNPS